MRRGQPLVVADHLPGLAGIALTVGMSVDANVLINERIREELRAGVPPKAAIAAGYDKASGTIADANLTAIARHIGSADLGTKLQALSALGLMGEAAEAKLDDVVRALEDGDPLVVETAVTTLVKMGAAAKPAIPELEKLLTRGTRKEEKEFYRNLAEAAIKMIKGVKPGAPGAAAGGMPEARNR